MMDSGPSRDTTPATPPDDDTGARITKCVNVPRVTPASPLIDLPEDVWNTIFGLVTPEDVVTFSMLDSTLRQWLVPRIFSSVHCTWHMAKSERPPHIQTIRSLRISNPSSYSEWHIDVFPVLRAIPHLHHLYINTLDSANWLRYRRLPRLDALTLECSELPKRPRYFNLNHLHDFVCLTSLTIHQYHCNWPADELAIVNLTHLTVVGCTWDYPFKLSQFNPGQFLEVLTVRYHRQDTFLHSHLFGEFLTKPDPNFASVKHLILDCPRSLPPSMFCALTNNFSGLRRLSLKGWDVATHRFGHLYCRPANLRRLTHLAIDLPNKTEADDLATQLAREYPDIYFSSRVNP
ncbi:hypothetical protein DICA3_F04962 [Diutina catenulata]